MDCSAVIFIDSVWIIYQNTVQIFDGEGEGDGRACFTT